MRAVAIAGLGWALCSAGCGLALDYDPPDPRAGDAGPSGGFDGGGPVVDAAAPDAGATDAGGVVVADATMGVDAGFDPPAGPCGGPSFIQDHFDDPSTPAWGAPQVVGGGMAGEVGGRAVFTVPAGVADAAASYASFQFYDARGDSIAAQVFPARSVSAGGEVVLALLFDEDHFAAIFLANGRMGFTVVEGGVRSAGMSLDAYDGLADRWWRIGGRGGAVVFETSPDGATWNPLGSLVAPAFLEAVRVVIGVHARVALTAPLTAEFDDLGRAPSSIRQPPCPIDSYTDELSTGLDRFRWERLGEEESCDVGLDAATGSLRVRPITGECGIRTLHAYDATDRWLTLELARGPSSPEYAVELILSRPIGRVVVSCAGISGALLDGPASAAFTCTSIRYWRLGRIGTDWILEATADRSSWTRLATIGASFDPSRLTVTLVARPTGSKATFDDALLLSAYNP